MMLGGYFSLRRPLYLQQLLLELINAADEDALVSRGRVDQGLNLCFEVLLGILLLPA
jgi:hypothetical protein